MLPVSAEPRQPLHPLGTRSTGTRRPRRKTGAAQAPIGDVVLRADDLKKYYQVGSNALFGGDTRVVKANETISFEAREAETLAIVGELGCGKSTLAKVLLGLETATSGALTLGNLEIGSRAIESRDTGTVSSIQMVFQNPLRHAQPEPQRRRPDHSGA